MLREYCRLTGRTFASLFQGLFRLNGIRIQASFDQLIAVGIMAIPTVGLASLLMGIVLAMQGAYQLERLGATEFVADLVGVSLLREIGPLMTAVVVISRSGSAITAEIGTMKVAEEIEALEVMAIDPVRYLVVPRFISMLIMLPCLTILGECLGIFGGWLIAVGSLHMDPLLYITRFIDAVVLRDLFSGLLKSVVFGFLIGTISCHYGMRVEGGAEGVGKATTLSVVTSLTSILAADAILTALFYFV